MLPAPRPGPGSSRPRPARGAAASSSAANAAEGRRRGRCRRPRRARAARSAVRVRWIHSHVPGRICMIPRASALDTRSLLKPLSCHPIASASEPGTPFAAADRADLRGCSAARRVGYGAAGRRARRLADGPGPPDLVEVVVDTSTAVERSSSSSSRDGRGGMQRRRCSEAGRARSACARPPGARRRRGRWPLRSRRSTFRRGSAIDDRVSPGWTEVPAGDRARARAGAHAVLDRDRAAEVVSSVRARRRGSS